jgi:hypothetical protein
MNIRDLIFNANDLTRKEVDVPEWGCKVYLRSWSGQDRARLLKLHHDSQKRPDVLGEFNAWVLVLSAVDQDGKPVFTDQDLTGLQKKSGAVLDRLAKDALELNGLTSGAVDAAEKN